MALYVQTVIETPEGKRLQPGDKVPADLPGLTELKRSGAVGKNKPDHRVVAGDGGTASDVRA